VLYWRDPQRTVEHMQRELAHGRPVTLLGETGKPTWYRWRAGEGRSAISQAQDGTLLISTWSANGLLELLPDVERDNYRITAQVSHRSSSARVILEAGCGLFFAHRTLANPGGDLQLGVSVHFNDVHGRLDIVRVLPEDVQARVKVKDNVVDLEAWFFREGP